MNEIKLLALSEGAIENKYRMPSCATVMNVEKGSQWQDDWEEFQPEVVLIDRGITELEADKITRLAKAYTVFYTDMFENYHTCQELVQRKLPLYLADVQSFLDEKLSAFYGYSYGEKFHLKDVDIAHGFKGSVKWNGDTSIDLKGDFGDDFNQILYFRGNIPMVDDVALDLWLEYEGDPGVEVMLKVTQFVTGSLADISRIWEFSGDDLKDIMVISNNVKGPLFFSVFAKGEGLLRFKALHDRHSRLGYGAFIPGGERYCTSKGEEVFCYFDPGDLKPPMSVFFSGYKTKQGFEGYNLMRRMGKPFLLVAESRLEGGAFYMGSPEYECLVADVIRKYIERMGFTNKQVIMSGISMGTFGATYYGCDIRPKTLILGNPLFNVGTIAENERLNRPGGFPTSVDVLLYLYGDTSSESVEKLNQRFWTKFRRTDWRDTRFVISYMYEDDYDGKAYEDLLSNLSSTGVEVYGKGLHGRHNDNTNGIVEWFSSQYEKYLDEEV